MWMDSANTEHIKISLTLVHGNVWRHSLQYSHLQSMHGAGGPLQEVDARKSQWGWKGSSEIWAMTSNLIWMIQYSNLTPFTSPEVLFFLIPPEKDLQYFRILIQRLALVKLPQKLRETSIRPTVSQQHCLSMPILLSAFPMCQSGLRSSRSIWR